MPKLVLWKMKILNIVVSASVQTVLLLRGRAPDKKGKQG